MKLASTKQVEYATRITKTLNVSLPQTNSSYDYWKFINDNKLKFRLKTMHSDYCPDEEAFMYDSYPADIEIAYD